MIADHRNYVIPERIIQEYCADDLNQATLYCMEQYGTDRATLNKILATFTPDQIVIYATRRWGQTFVGFNIFVDAKPREHIEVRVQGNDQQQALGKALRMLAQFMEGIRRA